MRGNFDNTGKLVRFMLRRERIMSAIWLIILLAFSVALAPGIDTMFPDAETRENISLMYDNPIMITMMGPIYSADGEYTMGSIYAGMILIWMIIAVAIMNILLIVRHTRTDEERWRAEVVRSLPVGRLANINAAMLTALIINAVLAVLTGLGMAATGVEGMDFAGCMLYGAVMAAGGLVFAAITAVFCQLSSSSGGALGWSFLALGGFYMLRAVGDVSNEALSLISPLGLAQRSKVFAGNDIIPLIALLLITAAITILAYKLNSVRDLGQGFIPARPGRREAKKALLSPFGLALRLCRNAIIIWIICMLMLGASYGSIIGEIDKFVGDSPEYLALIGIPQEALEHLSDEQKAEIIVDGFGMFVTGMMTMIALVPLLIFAMKLRSEEKDGRVEHIISRSVSRTKYLACYVIITFIMSVLVQSSTAFGLYGAAASGEFNPFVLDGVLKAALVYLPAVWVMVGVAVLAVGLFPKAMGVVWGYYGFVCFMMFMSSFPDLFPEWVTNLSPMKFVPSLPVTSFNLSPADEFNFVPLIIMTGIGAVLTAVGFVTYSKRDMATH